MIDPLRAIPAVSFLKACDFYIVKNGWVYDAILAARERGAVDFVTVCAELERAGRLEEAGGAAYVTRLINVVPTAAHVEAYARQVREMSARRRLIQAATQLASQAYDMGTSVSDTVSAASRSMSDAVHLRGRLQPADEVADEVFERASEWREHPAPGGVRWIRTGLATLDKMTGGLEPQKLMILGARPSIGKSALAGQMALTAARDGRQVVFFALEMTSTDVLSRQACGMARQDSREIRAGNVSDVGFGAFTSEIGALADLGNKLLVCDDATIDSLDVRAMVSGLDLRGGLVIVDYLQLLRDSNDNEVLRLSTISKNLKAIAKESGAAMVAVHQLSRRLEHRADRRPRLSDLRDSGALEQDADQVLFLHTSDVVVREATETELVLAKNRGGSTGIAKVWFWKKWTLFGDMAQEEE